MCLCLSDLDVGLEGTQSSYFIVHLGLGITANSYFIMHLGLGGTKSLYFVVLFAIPGVKSSYCLVLFGFGDVKRSHLVVLFGIAGAHLYLVISILDGYSRIEVESVIKYISKKASYIFSYLHFGRL